MSTLDNAVVENTDFVVDLDCGIGTNPDQGVDLCAFKNDSGKPVALTLTYDFGTTIRQAELQDDGKVEVDTFASAPAGAALIIVRSKGGDPIFEGLVQDGASFTVDNAGEKFGSETTVEIRDPATGQLIQAIEFHTSCSQPIAIGDMFGSVTLAAAELEDGTTFGLTETKGDEGVQYFIAGAEDGGPIDPSIPGNEDAALFTVDRDTGVVRFVTPPDFENPLDDGADNVYNVIVRAVRTEETREDVTIDFSGLARGTVVSDQFPGLTITGSEIGEADADNDAMIFDGSAPTGGDFDLFQPGQGNMLIVSEDDDSSDPDDALGGAFTFEFDQPVSLDEIKVFDTEEGGVIRMFGENGAFLKTVSVPSIGDGEGATVDLSQDGVTMMMVVLTGSGALDDLKYSVVNSAGTIEEKPLHVTVEDDCIHVHEGDRFVVDLDCGKDIPDLGLDACVVREDGGFDKPNAFTFTLGEELTNAIVSGQKEGKVEVDSTGASATGPSVFVRVSESSDPDKTDKEFFAGLVEFGASFTALSANGDKDKFGGETHVHIFAADGTTLLQSIEFHTSCSQPLVIGDQYGTVSLTGFGFEGDDGGQVTFGQTEEAGDVGVIYKIIGGDDADLFRVDPATGVVEFIAAPDFEAPLDVGADNTYEVVVGAFDADNPTVLLEEKPLEVCIKDKPGDGGQPDLAVFAADDALTVFETETTGDLEELDNNPNAVESILDNDTEEDGQPYDGLVVTVDGQTANIGQFVDLSGGGRIMINADGTVDFDADGDFDALDTGETDTVQVEYSIAKSAGSGKTNLLFVIDTSGSTLSNGLPEGIFDGENVGDVNGDGRSNTPLDAELAAVKAAIADLLSQGVDPSSVTVGIVTFNTQGRIEGTFALDDPALIDALHDIRGNVNGWTNYDDALDKSIDWFGTRPDDGADNKIVFLSDGVPRDPDGVSIQDLSVYGPEIAELTNAGGIDATVEAIGVGAQSELIYLDDLDTTGGAVQVTDATSLTTSVTAAAQVTVSDTATVTVTVLGISDGDLAVFALDDALTVQADEGAGDLETLLTNEDSILANDLRQEGSGPVEPYLGDVITVEGIAVPTGGETPFIALTRTDAGNVGAAGGLVRVLSDGRLDFDANGDFDDLNVGDVGQTTFQYTIAETVSDEILIEDVWFGAAPDEPDAPKICIDSDTDGVEKVEWDYKKNSEELSFILKFKEEAIFGREGDDVRIVDIDISGIVAILNDLGASDIDIEKFKIKKDKAEIEIVGYDIDFGSDDHDDIEEIMEAVLGPEVPITLTLRENGVERVETVHFCVEKFDSHSPIAFDLNGDGQINTTGATTAMVRTVEATPTVEFDIDADGETESIEWLDGTGDALLVDNRDGNAATDMSGARLFGNQNFQVGTAPSAFANGFEKLAALDANGDGVISGAELVGLVLWQDDGDAVVEGGEFLSIEDVGVERIDLGFNEDTTDAFGNTLMRSTATANTRTVTDEATVTVNVLGQGNPLPDFTLTGTVTTAPPPPEATQTLTLIVEHSFDNMRDGSVAATFDLSGNASLTNLDFLLAELALLSATLEDSREINILITGQPGAAPGAIVGELQTTAAEIKAALDQPDVTDPPADGLTPLQNEALRDLFTPQLVGAPGQESEIDFSSAFERTIELITQVDPSTGVAARPDGGTTDDVIVLATSDGAESFVFDPITFELIPVPYRPAEFDAALAQLQAIGVDIDVLLVDPLDGTGGGSEVIETLLEEIDSNGLDVFAGDADLLSPDFDLDALVAEPDAAPTVLNVTNFAGGLVAAADGDPAVDGFQFDLTGLTEDPRTTGLILNVDRDGDALADEQIDVTDQLVFDDTTDTFSLDFVLV